MQKFVGIKSDYSKIPINEMTKIIGLPSVIVEAGAADGVDTENFCRLFPKARIFAIEPVPAQFDYLIKKFANCENIELFNLAFSSKSGWSKLIIGKGSGDLGGMGSSSLMKPKHHEKIFPDVTFSQASFDVETIPLQNFIEKIGVPIVDLLWLDIQGKELEVLTSSKGILQQTVKSIHLEVSRLELYEGAPTPREIHTFLKGLGFIRAIDRVGAIAGNAFYYNKYLVKSR
jgi:FkbM family methyltransferase